MIKRIAAALICALVLTVFVSCSDVGAGAKTDVQTNAPSTAQGQADTAQSGGRDEATEDADTYAAAVTDADDAGSDTAPDVTERGALDGKIIVLDPGHGTFTQNFQEPVSPNSSETKKAFSTGTEGKYMTEADLVLKLAQMLRPMLEAEGATVYMTREDGVSISNVERAKFANELNADLAFRIHADGNDNHDVYGMSMLVPAKGTIGSELETESRKAGEIILAAMIESTGAKDRGVVERSNLTGFNWSTVPVVLVETGFMSNPDEDALLSTDAYQQKLVDGMFNGIINYFAD